MLALVILAAAGGCAKLPGTGVTALPAVTPLKPASWSELRDTLLTRKADVDQFRLRGPFEVATHKDRELRLSGTERYTADLYLSAPAGQAPLVILLHGHDNSKDDHAYQALHLASWGIHSLAVQLPKAGPWIDNGRALARIVTLIHRRLEILDSRVDVSRIILAGHSFGGAAVTIALAEGAPAAGGILLDPAGIGKELIKFLGRVNKPVMLLGADERVSPVRDRAYFYEYIRSGIAEISIKNATHDDAEFPLEPGGDSTATEELQITFVSALTAAAVSLGHTGNFDYAWNSLGEAIRSGRFFDALRK